MRYTGPVRFAFHGDKAAAQRHTVVARGLLGVMAAASQQPFSTRSVTLSNGVRITVKIFAQPTGADRDWAEDALNMMWSGQHQVSAHIYAPPGTEEIPLAEEDVLQYQYAAVATGDNGYEVVEYSEENDLGGTPLVSGAWVVVLFVATEQGTVLTASFPIVSTLSYIKPDEGTEEDWLWLDAQELGAEETYQQVLAELFIKRYEVVQATANHVLVGDKLIHAPWMPKGVTPYNSYGFCFGGMREAGLADAYSYEVDSSGQQTTVSNSASAQLAYSSFHATDAGYEDSLKIYRPAPSQGLDAPVKTTSNGGAPDADWYETYTTFEADTILGQAREFGVLIDSSQRIHVWMTEAEGTADTAGSDYLDQSIKTSVADEYVKTTQLALPSSVEQFGAALRDVFPDFETIDEQSTRYAWVSDNTGKRFAAVGIERVYPPIGYVVGMAQDAPIDLFYAPNDLSATSDTAPKYWVPRPVLIELNLEVQVFGEGLSDFLIANASVTKRSLPDGFYLTEVAFAKQGAFEGVEEDTVLLAGFEGRTLLSPTPRDKSVFESSFSLLQYMYYVGQTSTAPVPFLTPTGLRLYTTHYLVPERRGFHFGSFGDDAVADAFASLVREYTYETEFVVYADDAAVFRKTAKKVVEEEGRNDVFTAQVVATDLKWGAVAFGTAFSSSVIGEETGVDSVTRSHVVYYRGQVLEAENPLHLAELETPLESEPFDPEHTNFAMTGVILSPVATPFYSANYYSEVIGSYESAPNTVRIHFDDFPWGLEIYAHMTCNLYVPSRASHQLIVDNNFVSFVWGYHKQAVDLEWDVNTNEAVSEPTFEYQSVDLLSYQGTQFSHHQFFEQAFREEDEKTVSTSFIQNFVGAYATGVEDGDAVGYPLHRNYMLLGPEDEWAVNLESPAYRQYCAGVTFPGSPNSVHFSESSGDWAVLGQVLPGFANRVYGYLETEDGD